MSITTGRQIGRYYELFKQVEVTFNKQVIAALGLLPKQVYLKCGGVNFPCLIYSASMTEAKVLANLNPEAFETFREANNSVSLRFSFRLSDKPDPLSFFVTAKIAGFNPYSKNNPNLHFASLTYIQRPPDDLIEMLGELLEANANAKRRKEFRIIITSQIMKEIGLTARETTVDIQSVPRKCIIRDLSFSGAKVLLMGLAKFLVNKSAVLHLSFEDRNEHLEVPGKVVRFEEVQGRRDITAIALQFEEGNIPIAYKMYLNAYLKTKRPGHRPEDSS